MITIGLIEQHPFISTSSYDIPNGVSLSPAAVGRFERLADRIRLYCLSEIETCLAEKESLAFLVSSSSNPIIIGGHKN